MWKLILFSYSMSAAVLSFAQPTKLDSLTVRIESYKCPSIDNPNGGRILTGVKINSGKYSGIITSLHGVCGCDEIVVFDAFGNSAPVYLEFANVEKDIAILNSKEINEIFQGGYHIPDSLDIKGLDTGIVFINGHPLGSDITTRREVKTFNPALVPLNKIIGPQLINELKKRNSPQIDVVVLRYEGGSGPGTSGAPVICNDQLIAIQNGGLIGYGELTCWGVPLIDFEKWEFIRGNDLKKDLRYRKISMPPSDDLYSVRPEYPKRPSVVFPDTSALKLYILPFTNRQGEKLVGLEQAISNSIVEEFESNGILVLYESNKENLPSIRSTASRYAHELNADVILYGDYSQFEYESGVLTLNFTWKDSLDRRRYGGEKELFSGRVSLNFEGETPGIASKNAAVDIQNFLYFFQGLNFFFDQQYDMALQKFDSIDERAGNPMPDMHFVRGLIYKEEKLLSNYLNELDYIIQRDTMHWNALYELSEYYRLNEFDDIEMFTQENLDTNKVRREALLYKMIQRFPQKSDYLYRELAYLYGAHWFFWMDEADTEDILFNGTKALFCLNKCIEIDSTDFLSRQAKSNMYWLNNQPDIALTEIIDAYSIQIPFALEDNIIRLPWDTTEVVNFDYLSSISSGTKERLTTRKDRKRKEKEDYVIDRVVISGTEWANNELSFYRQRMKRAKKYNRVFRNVLKDSILFSTLITGAAAGFGQGENREVTHILLDSAIQIDQSNFLPHLVKARAYEVLDSNYVNGLNELMICLELCPNNSRLLLVTAEYIKKHGLGDSLALKYYIDAITISRRMRSDFRDSYFGLIRL